MLRAVIYVYSVRIGESVPCLGTVKGIRGYDGKELWTINTYGTVFEINCNLDINLDGHMDCIGTGRLGTCLAFNPLNGNSNVRQSFVHMLCTITCVVFTMDCVACWCSLQVVFYACVHHSVLLWCSL